MLSREASRESDSSLQKESKLGNASWKLEVARKTQFCLEKYD